MDELHLVIGKRKVDMKFIEPGDIEPGDIEPQDKKDIKRQIIECVICLALFIFVLFVCCAHAQPVMPANLWQGLIAEDVSGGYQGMYAVACCVRNRLNAGMNAGLVALKRKDLNQFCQRQGVKYERMAKDIVRKVFFENAPDVTKGATHYEAVERYGLPRWAHGMVRVARIGEHTFFKHGY